MSTTANIKVYRRLAGGGLMDCGYLCAENGDELSWRNNYLLSDWAKSLPVRHTAGESDWTWEEPVLDSESLLGLLASVNRVLKFRHFAEPGAAMEAILKEFPFLEGRDNLDSIGIGRDKGGAALATDEFFANAEEMLKAVEALRHHGDADVMLTYSEG